MPFLRLSRDRRGYESTFLLHIARPGDPPRVLYWYRTAPAVRVGRPALDEDAIRTIEEQHPDIEFDWSHILEVGAAAAVEVERQLPRRRKAARARAAASPESAPEAESLDDVNGDVEASVEPGEAEREPEAGGAPSLERPRAHDLLEELVGRDIATRLHARYAELSARISGLAVDEATREAWRARAEPLNPDTWVTPAEVLSGVERADALFDALRRELPSHS